jgi:excisionase family DNA binding protein
MKLTAKTELDGLDPLLTVVEVAKILRCSERTIRRRVKSGRLAAVQVGRRFTFRPQDVAEFVRRSLTTTPPGQAKNNIRWGP